MSQADPAVFEALRASPLAEELTADQAAVLAAHTSLQSFGPEEILWREGAVDNRLIVVVEGSLRVVRYLGTPNETPIVTLQAGDLAHELGFLDGTPHLASLVALTAVRVLILEREKLETLIDSHPQILYRVMCAIVRTVHRVQTRLSVQAIELTNYIVKQHGRY